MKKIKRFFDVLTKSLTNISYYKDILHAKFSFSLKYLFFIFYLISLVSSIIFSILIGTALLPQIPGFVHDFQKNAVSFYPKGLVVNVKNGEVSTNQKEPYVINNFITIDTKADPSQLKDYKTPALVTKDSVVTQGSTPSTYQVYKIDTGVDMTIDQAGYSKVISQISPYLKYLQPGIIILIILSILIWPFVAGVLLLLYQLVYLLIWSPILFLAAKLMKKKLTFGKTYQLAMHASTLPILLKFVVTYLGLQMPFLIGTAILIIFMILVINQF